MRRNTPDLDTLRARLLPWIAVAILFGTAVAAHAQQARVVEIATRPGVTQRFLYLAPEKPKAAAVLFPGGQGDLQIMPDGSVARQKGNFLVRSRELFVEQGIAVAVVGPPSDRQNLAGFRQTRDHVEDIGAVIDWLRREAHVPVWLVGTSRGTLSAAYISTQLQRGNGADGVVLTSTVLAQSKNTREGIVLDLALERIDIPVLVVHHKQDGCRVCPISEVPRLMNKLTAAPRKEFLAVEGGISEGDPCEAFAYHGYNGIEREVVAKIAAWLVH